VLEDRPKRRTHAEVAAARQRNAVRNASPQTFCHLTEALRNGKLDPQYLDRATMRRFASWIREEQRDYEALALELERAKAKVTGGTVAAQRKVSSG
jgi:hypothetical protein